MYECGLTGRLRVGSRVTCCDNNLLTFWDDQNDSGAGTYEICDFRNHAFAFFIAAEASTGTDAMKLTPARGIMKTGIAVISALIVSALSGCVTTQQVVWVRAWPGTNEIYKDRAQCEYEVTAAIQFASPGITRGVNNPIGAGIVAGIDIGFRRAELFVQCMRAKGWRRAAQDELSAPTVTVTSSGEATRAPTVIQTPVTQNRQAQVATKWLLQAERAAKAERCADSPLANISVVGPGFETYSVPCSNGDTMTVRCEAGMCRALK